MQFLNPLALAGLAAALIPLAIHLLQRGRKRPQPFSNLAFLRQLNQSHMRRLRLRQWLVLLLRTLAVALLVAAFARPTYREGAFLGGGSNAAVVLLDQSLSTAYRTAAGSDFARLRRRALEVLGLFDEGDRVRLVHFAGAASAMDRPPAQLAERVAALNATQGATDAAAALAEARRFLADSPQENRELFVLSDLTRRDWEGLGDVGRDLPATTVYLPRPAGARPNVFIDEIAFDPWLAAPGGRQPLRVRVNNAAPAGTAVGVDVFLAGERVDHRELDLQPGERRLVEFSVAPRRAGRLDGWVVAGEDALPGDDRRYFSLQVPAAVRVLLLGDRPADTYFLRRALSAAAQHDLALRVDSALHAEWDPALLDAADVVFLCNLRRLDNARLRTLRDFVAAGGGLALMPAADADLNYLNRYLLPELVSARLQAVTGRPDGDAAHGLDPDAHPLFARLLHDVPGDQARFKASFAVQAAESTPLLRFSDGRPALVSEWQGRGRVALWAVPPALEWHDLPFKGVFVPAMQRLARLLALPPQHAETYTVGQTARRHIPGLGPDGAPQAEAPSGRRLFLGALAEEGRYHWPVPGLDEAGIWRLLYEGEELDRWAVNLDPAESDLAPAAPDALAAVFGGERTVFLENDAPWGDTVRARRYGRELWREFLLAAAILLMAELWLARAPRSEAAAA